MSLDPKCSKCGTLLPCWLTESGDYLVTQPCPEGCTGDMKDNFTTDEDFNEGD